MKKDEIIRSRKQNQKSSKDIDIKAKVENPIFRKNLQALFQKDELLAAHLFGIEKQEKYEIFIGKDPIDINLIDRQSLEYVYEKPVANVHSQLEILEKQYKRYPFMYFYGLGNGILYKALLANKTHKRILVVEPEIEIIYSILHLIDLSEELANERLVLFYSKFMTFTQVYFTIANSTISSYMKLYDMHVHSPFYDKFSDDVDRINKYFTRAFLQYASACGNSIDDNLQGIRQNLENIVHAVTNYPYYDLVKARLKKVQTAIIVATGPSLTKQLPLLKKVAPYVSVISVDASYPILLKHGIAPDYVTSIERVPATSTFFLNKDKKIDKNIYFVVATLTHADTIRNLKDRKLVLTMRPGSDEMGYKLKRHGYLGIGHSTANQAYQLAYVLKHKQIVLIGQDLAFGKDGSSHAIGHTFTESGEYDLFTTAYGGEGEVRTTHIWNIFKNQYEKDIEEASKEDIKTYNCTEGGAHISGTIERPFSEIVDEILASKKTKNLPQIQKVSFEDASKSMLQIYDVIQKKVAVQTKVKERIEKVFLSIVPKIDKFLAIKNEGKLGAEHFDELVKISDKIDKVKDFIMSRKNVKIIENILAISVNFQELELAKISVAPSDTKEQKVDKLIQWLEMHKYWLFSAAGGLNADIETTTSASKNLIKEMKRRGILPVKNK
ncbi:MULTISPECIES: motility associated factor glycosyltransferase family protein [unclassified Campylobacter]|uniref:motility associated factor glycosyltransferase family protein n=1 Tax=unclassified Campylobacter TaxID=2593542 RepID=UPI003D328642